ncbi:MAG TPA: response regulator [Polyangia bacterium]|nr:response regulator [Polyangia bacterium]
MADDSKRTPPIDSAPAGGVRNVAEPRPLILIIEDDFALRRSLAEYLSFEGYEVECAADGLEGLKRLEVATQRLPSVILLDMIMPHMNGLEFCAQQKLTPTLPKIPIIAVTGESLSKQDISSLGLHRAFTKPLNLGKLLETIRELVPETKP